MAQQKHPPHSSARPGARRTAAVLLGLAGLLPAPFALAPVHAASLAALIHESAQEDPSVLEARARQEQATMQTQVSRSGHWPVLGVQAQQEFDQKYKDLTNPDPVALTGKLNLFSAGAISSRVERDKFREEFYGNKTLEAQENLAINMAQLYLSALRHAELLQTEQQNLQRHDKIIGDLNTIVRHDPGRNYELVQAQSRALQVRMRMVQYEKAMRLALSKLARYTTQKVTLADPFNGTEWRKHYQGGKDTASHPSVQAQMNEMKATRSELDNLRRSRWPSVDLVVAAGKEHRSTRVVLNWNFLDRGAFYSQQGAAKQLAAAESRVQLLEREISERSQTAQADMAQSQLQAAAAQAQIGASRQVVDLYEMQFRIARRSLLDVLNAYAELANVEVSKVTADNDYRTAVASYLDANAALVDWARQAAIGQVPQQRTTRSLAPEKPAPAMAVPVTEPVPEPQTSAEAPVGSAPMQEAVPTPEPVAAPAAPVVTEQTAASQPLVAPEAAPAPVVTHAEEVPAPAVPAPTYQESADMQIGVSAFAPAPRADKEDAPRAVSANELAEQQAADAAASEQTAPTGEFRPILTTQPLSAEFRDTP